MVVANNGTIVDFMRCLMRFLVDIIYADVSIWCWEVLEFRKFWNLEREATRIRI